MVPSFKPVSPALSGESLRHAIRDSVAKFLDLRANNLFIFGSEAGRGETSRSDIDIGIEGPQAIPATVLRQIRDELENLRTLRTFDVVDFRRVDERFRTVALQNVEKL